MAVGGQFEMQAIVYPPLVYEKDGKLWGVAPEVVKEIQKLVGDDSELKAIPWLRGLRKSPKSKDAYSVCHCSHPRTRKTFQMGRPGL